MTIRVYVAGPYSGGEPEMNVRVAVLAGDELLNAGLVPFVPHLCHFWHYLCPRTYEEWMAYDLAWLEVCDCLLRLPGESSGADAEVAEMERLGKPVFHLIADVLEWAMALQP